MRGVLTNEMEDYQKAEVDYINGMKYKDIAEKYGKALSTVKSWKQRYKWRKDKSTVDLKKEQEGMRTKSKSTRTKKFVDEQIEKANNSDLTEREEMFCMYYAQRPNQTKAYMEAYDNSNYKYSANKAWQLMKKDRIIKRIRELKRGAQETALIELADIVNELKRQAFTDISDYLEYKKEKILFWKTDENGVQTDEPILDPETGEQRFAIVDTVHLKDVESTDSGAVKSVKINKDGKIELELYDKQKALIELMKFMNDKTMQGARLQKLQADTEISQGKAKLMVGSDDKVMDAVANLMDAFRGAAEDDKDD